MKNTIGSVTASSVNFTDNSQAFHGPVTEVTQLAALQAQMEDVRWQIDRVAPALDPGTAAAMRSAREEAVAALAQPEPDPGRVRTALDKLKVLAGGLASAAGIVESVDTIVATLSGVH